MHRRARLRLGAHEEEEAVIVRAIMEPIYGYRVTPHPCVPLERDERILVRSDPMLVVDRTHECPSCGGIMYPLVRALVGGRLMWFDAAYLEPIDMAPRAGV